MENSMKDYTAMQEYIVNCMLFSEMINSIHYQSLTESLREANERYILDNSAHLKYIDYCDKCWAKVQGLANYEPLENSIENAAQLLSEDFRNIEKFDIANKEETKAALLLNVKRLMLIYTTLGVE